MDRAEGQDAYSRFPGEPLDYVKRDVVLWIGRYTTTVSCAAKSVCRILGPQQQVVTATSTSKEEVVEMDVDALTTTPGAVLVDFDWTGKGWSLGWRSQGRNQLLHRCGTISRSTDSARPLACLTHIFLFKKPNLCSAFTLHGTEAIMCILRITVTRYHIGKA